MKQFKGTGVALITPFKSDGSIDFRCLEGLIEHVISGGVDYLVVLGTTAESVTLSLAEKQAIVSFVHETNNGRVPMVLGMGGNDTQQLVNLIHEYDLQDVDALLSVAPMYNKPNQKGIYQHFKHIASATSLPIILYNVPGRTSSNIAPETVKQLADEFPNIIGIKEASGNLEQVMQLASIKDPKFRLISGDDALTLPMCSVGGYGVISVLANAFPSDWSEMVGHALKSNFKAARSLHYKYLKMIQLIFADGNPAGIKALLSIMEICPNHLRLPLVGVNRSVYNQIAQEYESIVKDRKVEFAG